MPPPQTTSNREPADDTATSWAILDSLVEGIVVIDELGVVRHFNPAAERMVGWSVNQIVGQSVGVLIPSLDGLRHDGSPAEGAASGPSSGGIADREVTAKRSDGTLFPAHLSISELVLENGDRWWICELRDISEQKLAEHHLRDDTKRMRAILDTAVEGFITINEWGLIEVFNHAAEAIFRYPAEEVLGRNIKMLMPSPYQEEHDSYLARYRATGEKRIIGVGREVAGRRKDGTVFPMELSLSEVRLDDQFLFTAAVRDISERKSMEARMMQSERLAAIGEAMTGLTHESRNALQRSQACLEMLKMVVEENVEAHDLIEDIQRAQDDLHCLYEEVKDYAAPLTLQRKPHDIGQIVREAWANLSHEWTGRTIRFSADGGNLNLWCRVDAFSLRHVFQNIFDNSLAACADPVELVVTYAELPRGDGTAVQVSVSDNGPGLSPEARQKVFEPFFTTKTKGTGLGMAICQRLVLAHGGEIAVAERNGPGAEFLITLPRGHA